MEKLIGPVSRHYQYLFLEPFLADAYEASPFDDSGHLVPSAMRHFIPLVQGVQAESGLEKTREEESG